MDSTNSPSDSNTHDEDLKHASRGYSTDMSPEAISRRFEILNQLNEVCAWLGTATDLGPVEAPDKPKG